MLRLLKLFCCLLLVLTFVQGQDNPFKPQPLHPGPWVEMTHGEVWPRPKFQQSEAKFFVLDAENFKFQVGTYLHIHNSLYVYRARMTFDIANLTDPDLLVFLCRTIGQLLTRTNTSFRPYFEIIDHYFTHKNFTFAYCSIYIVYIPGILRS